MIDKKDIIEIGKFRKTHGLQGELNAEFDVDADFLESGKPLIVERDALPVPFYVETVRTKGSETYLVKLEGVDTQEEAAEFVNCPVYALRSDMVDYYGVEGEELFLADDLEGYAVVDVRAGKVGVVESIDDSTENELLVVRTDGGDEVMIPFTDDLLITIDDDKQEIVMELPDGLLDLNK